MKAPSKEKFAEWLQGIEHDQPADCYSMTDYTINSYNVDESSIEVDYEFLTVEPFENRESMFTHKEQFANGHGFPKSFEKIRLKERYTWESLEDMCDLSENYVMDCIDVDVTDVDWDNPNITDEMIQDQIERYEADSIGCVLVEEYDADVKMPEFIPERLIPFFNKCIFEYRKISELS